MSNLVIQKSFSSGEWAPELNARVDLAKYHAAAGTLRNFFVDYRGGASTRTGTKFVAQGGVSAQKIRLIPFQASFTVNYVLEFGAFYIRFYNNGAPVLEAVTNITGVTNANPGVITDTAHGYNTGDRIFIANVGGTTQLNNNYYIVQVIGANSYSLTDLFGNAVNTSSFGVYTSGGTAQRVYTLVSPYQAADLALVKFTQSVNTLILCHPNYPPQVLTLISAANWTITSINFNPTIGTPQSAAVTTTLGNGSVNYGYTVTAVDVNGQESGPATPATLSGKLDLRTIAGTNTVTWNAVAGALSYNVYKAQVSYAGAVPSGSQYGFIGNSTGTSFIDSNIAPNFALCPPIIQNPFVGASVISLTLTGNANYTTVPGVTIAAPGSGVQATAYVSLGVTSFTINGGGGGYAVGNNINLGNGVIIQVTSVTGHPAAVNGAALVSGGSLTGAGTNVPSNPVSDPNPPAGGTAASFNLTWNIGALVLVQGGAGYTSAPAVTFSAGAATATANLGPSLSGAPGGPTSQGNPSVPGFFDQRLVLAAPLAALQTFYMSQPGAPYNFSISDPIQANDAITGSIVSGKLNAIKSMLNAPSGLIIFTSQQAWEINGGSAGASVTPIDITAVGHAYNGASDVPPLQINYDFLYVQAKGSIVRDLTFNFYTRIYTGTDISVLSSHLLFGHTILEWAYAEAPFSVVWAVREDGILLSLTYVKEQEMIGWARSDTKGQFKSVCSVTETLPSGVSVDAVYVVVQRTVNGQSLQYIERMADRFTPYGAEDCWALDSAVASLPSGGGLNSNASVLFNSVCTPAAASGSGVIFNFTATAGLAFSAGNIGNILRVGGGVATITGVNNSLQIVCTITKAITAVTPDDPSNTPLPSTEWSLWNQANTFSGLQNLTGQTISALADGTVVTGLVVSASGSITLANGASKVVAGLPFTPQLKTLAIDVGDPTIQDKVKNIPFSNLRVRNTLGLSMGRNFSTLVVMKDLVLGNVNSTATGLPAAQQTVSDLWTGDARTFMDSAFTTAGQYCIEQDQPYYATVLGTIPSLTVGDR